MPSSSSVIPSTPFMGVRISWLMLARNSDLARLAALAASRAAVSSSFDCPSSRIIASSWAVRRVTLGFSGARTTGAGATGAGEGEMGAALAGGAGRTMRYAVPCGGSLGVALMGPFEGGAGAGPWN